VVVIDSNVHSRCNDCCSSRLHRRLHRIVPVQKYAHNGRIVYINLFSKMLQCWRLGFLSFHGHLNEKKISMQNSTGVSWQTSR